MDIKKLSKYGISEDLINEYINKINNGDKIIAVTGEFSSGKSTFINALINKKRFLPSSNIECTPVLIDLIKSNTSDIEVKYNDGRVEHFEATRENIGKYAKNVENYDKSILGITIPVESDHLLENYHLIDTPGTNTTHEEHELITKEIIRKSDLVLYVFNKVLTIYDIEKIKEVKKYTSDMLFILTHMDDEVEGKHKNKDKVAISKFVLEAQEDLKNKLGIECSVLPIGSQAAYEDTTLIDEIRENINFAAKCNNAKKIKLNAKKQLSVIFEKRLQDLIEELDLLKSLSEVDGEKLSANIKYINSKINKIKMDEEDIAKNFNKIVKDNKVRIENNIKDIYKREEEEIVSLLVSQDEIDEELLEATFDKSSERLNKKVKTYLDKVINELINQVYLENNAQLEGINTELDLKLEVKLHLPSIEELDLTYDEDLSKIREERIIANMEIEAITDEVADNSDHIENLKDNLCKVDEKHQEIKNQIINNGSYMPEYEEVVEAGGASAGKLLGRVIGEVADIALIIVSPATGILKVADTVKDSTKLVQYATKAIKSTQEGIQKAGKVIKVVREAPGGKLLKILDLASVGGIGEKIGGALGESIKPSKVVYVENEAKKQMWIDENEKLKESRIEVKRRQAKLEDDIENANISIGEAGKRKREIGSEIVLSEERERVLIARKEREYYENNRKALEDYYKDQIGRVCSDEVEETVDKVKNIIEFATQQILIKSGNEFNNRLVVLKETIDVSIKSRDEITNKLQAKSTIVEEFKNYKEWIDTWIV